VSVSQSVELRQRGWRPRGSTCEACGRRVWGPGVAGNAVFEAWEDKQAIEDASRGQRLAEAASKAKGHGPGESDGRDKGKSLDTRPSSMLIEPSQQQHQQRQKQQEQGQGQQDGDSSPEQAQQVADGTGTGTGTGTGGKDQPLGPLVVLACRHIYHQSCLDSLQEKQENVTGVVDVVRNRDTRYGEYKCPIDG
jgi:hypothetical protein